MRAEKLFVGFAVLAIAAAFVGNADAYCRTTTTPASPNDPFACSPQGLPLYHPSSCVTYRILNRNPESDAKPIEEILKLSDSLSRVFSAWTSTNELCNGIALIELPKLEVAKVAEYVKDGPNHNMIGFTSGWQDRETLALTTLTFNASTGVILDADMELNPLPGWVSSAQPPPELEKYDLDSALLHEAGHFLGLSHVDDPNAVMFASYTPGAVRRKLTDDDENGICAIYPSKTHRAVQGNIQVPATACNLAPAAGPAAPPCGDPEIRHGCATSPSDASRSGLGTFAIFGAAAGAFAIARRRRRR